MSFSIIGTGSAVPDCVKTNADLSNIVDTSDEWITTRTGIKERHICTNEALSDILFKAAVMALEDAGTAAKELDLIICATIRGDYISPSLACVIHEKLGALASCPAFDINAACTGFIYALDVAAGYFARKKAKKVLILAAEAMSTMVDWNDRATCVLFGDGAGAAVLAAGDDLLSIRLTALGNTEALYIPHVTGNCPYSEKSETDTFLVMHGQDVYKFAVSAMCNDVLEVIKEAGIAKTEIDYVLPHQANIRIIDAAQKRLKIPQYKYITNIGKYGNTSAASIPLMLDESSRSGKLKKGDILVFSAFGGGFTTGACVLRWNK
ncbi:MAG: beta-ketoacyl-ACP synthase III [Bacillota bacterium]